jgi:hypothetical protein
MDEEVVGCALRDQELGVRTEGAKNRRRILVDGYHIGADAQRVMGTQAISGGGIHLVEDGCPAGIARIRPPARWEFLQMYGRDVFPEVRISDPQADAHSVGGKPTGAL